MSDINKLAVKITGDESGLKKASKEAKKDIASIGKSALSMGDIIKGSAIGSAIGNIVGQLAGTIGRAISNEMDAAFKRFDALNNYSKVMSNLRVGTDDSSTSIAILDQKLRGLPTSLSDAALGVQRFTAANGNIQASTDMYLAFNNAILAGGAATETQATGMEQLIQAYSKGKADAQEWRAMLIAMPAQLKQIAEAMGYTSTAIGGDFQTALNTGKISMNDFALTAIRLNKEGANGFQSFADQAKNATGGVQTSIANLKIALQRGIANIMQTLGQSNVAGFFNGIANAIDTASNYIAAFITIIKEAVAWVAALFGWGGSGSTEEIVQATGDASSALAGAAAGAEDTAGGLDDAAGAAKKLRKQLAAFDEMNVLQDKESEGGSGSGGAGGGGGAAGTGGLDYKWDTSGLDKAKDKIAEFAEKIKKMLKGIFGEIDFTEMGKAIQKLGKGLKNAIYGAWLIGRKFIVDFIQPLTKFAMENAIPRIFTAVGDALASIDFLKIAEAAGHVFQGFARIGQTLMDIFAGLFEILAPIGAWLANFVVPPALEIIATVLNTISSIIGGIWNALVGFYNATIKPLLDALAACFEPILNFLNEIFGAVNDNNTVWETLSGIVQAVAGFLLNLLKPAFDVITWVLNDLVRPAVEFLVGGLKALFGWLGDLLGITSETAREEENLSQKVSENTKQWDDNADGILQATEAMNHWDDAVLAVNNAEMRLMNSQEDLKKKTAELDQYCQQYGKTQDELTKLYHDNKLETLGLSDDALAKLKKAIIEAENAEIKMRAAQEEKRKADVAEQEMISAMWQDYNDLGRKLVDVAKQHGINSQEYDKAKKAMDEARQKAESYGEANMSIVDWTKVAAKEVENMGQKVLNTGNQLQGAAWQTGNNLSTGLINGINSNNGALYNAGYNQMNRYFQGAQKRADEHSPSKEAAKLGKFLGIGLVNGIEDTSAIVYNAGVENMGAAIDGMQTGAEQLAKSPKFRDLGTLEIANQFADLTARAQGTLELQNETTNDALGELSKAIMKLADKDDRIVVKIGEETIIDKVVDGINNASKMRNQTVIQL